MAKRKLAVREELKCAICLDNFKNPKVLPCCHSFCLHCLEGNHKRTKDKKSLTCPQCKANHQIPTNGPRGFPDDYTLGNQKHAPTTTPVCEQCDDKNKPVAYCHTCSDYLCDECLKAHKRLKAYRDHKTVNITPGKALDFKPQSKKSYLCSIHPEEPLKLYCKSCKSLACLLCFVGLHNGHDIGSINGKARQEVEQSINDLVKETNSKLTEFNDSLKYVSAIGKEKTEVSTPLKAQVDKKVDSLIQQLEARRKKLHKEIDDACTKDLKELWAQKEYHETAITNMEGALSFARRALACKEDTELLALCAQVTSRLQELSQLKWDIQETEKIEITTVTYTLEVSDNVSVGEVGVRIDEPTIEIEPIDMPSTFEPLKTVTIKVMAAFANILNIMPRDHHNLELSGTVSYSFYYSKKNNFKEVTVEAATNQNEWTVSFEPPSGTTSVTLDLDASGQYGQQLVEGSETFCLCNP